MFSQVGFVVVSIP